MRRSGPPPIPIYSQPAAKPEKESEILSSSLAATMGTIFLASAILLFIAGKSQDQKVVDFLGIFSINFTSIVLEALPFMLIGTLVGGVIEVFVPVALVDRLFGRGRSHGIFLASGLGLLFPTCECAIVPIVRRLIIKGVSIPSAIAFMLGGPIVNGIVAWSTAVAYTYNWKMVVLRLGCGYVVAVLVGLLLPLLCNQEKVVLKNIDQLLSNQCACGTENFHKESLYNKLFHAVHHARNDFLEVGKYLIIGAFIAAFMRTGIPVSSFDSISESPWLIIFVMMAMAMVLNLCSEADAFIAASFRWLLPGSAQLGFMVLGPMLDLKLMLMYLSVFRKRAIALLCLLTFFVVYTVMLLIEYFLPPFA